jgi:hypothetical protein
MFVARCGDRFLFIAGAMSLGALVAEWLRQRGVTHETEPKAP